MAEYIERAAAVKVVLRERKPTNSVAQNRMLSIIQRDLLTMCAADVVPVVHGRWEYTGKQKDTWTCSACGAKVGAFLAGCSAYCYHCGAKMDGGTT